MIGPDDDPVVWWERNHREELTARRLRVERAEREGDPRAPARRSLLEAMERVSASMLGDRYQGPKGGES